MADFGSAHQDQQLAADLRLALQLSENYARANSNSIFEDTAQRHLHSSSAMTGETILVRGDSDHSADTLQTSGDGCPSIKATPLSRRDSMDNSCSGSHYVRPESPPRIRDGDYARQSSRWQSGSSSSYQSGSPTSRSRGYGDLSLSPVLRAQSRRRDYQPERRRPAYQEDSLDDRAPVQSSGRVYQDEMMGRSRHREGRGGEMMRRSQHHADKGEIDMRRSLHYEDQGGLRRSRHFQDDMQRSRHNEGRKNSSDSFHATRFNRDRDFSLESRPENNSQQNPSHPRNSPVDRFPDCDDYGRPLPPTQESSRHPGALSTSCFAEEVPERSNPQHEDALSAPGPQDNESCNSEYTKDACKDQKYYPQDYQGNRQYSQFSAPKGTDMYSQQKGKYEPQECMGVRQIPARKISPPSTGSRYATKKGLPPPDEAIFMDIGQGVKARLRRSAETIKAIENDFYIPAVCVACSSDLFCITDVKYLFCPTCKSISPMTEGVEGIGLGFTYETLFQMQSEVMKGRNS